jgi:hypothetical protein
MIAAGGGRDLAWPQQRVAAELLARSGGRLVHLLLHGGARGADAAIGRAAQQLGWSSLVMPAQCQLNGSSMAGPLGQSVIGSYSSRPLPALLPIAPRAASPQCL